MVLTRSQTKYIELSDDDPYERTPLSSKNAVTNDKTSDQFDSICTQKIIEIMTTNKNFFKYSELQWMEKKVEFWESKYVLLYREFKEMAAILNVYKQELKIKEYARPPLQAVSCPRKEGKAKLPKQAIPLPKPDPVVSVEDHDDVVILEFETVESASSSTSKITNMTTKKQMPPLVTTSKTLGVSPKNVTASPMTVTAGKSLNPIYIGTTPTTIDLTGNDDVIIIDESNIINLDDSISPVKVPRRIAESLLPAGTSVNVANHPCNTLNNFRNEDKQLIEDQIIHYLPPNGKMCKGMLEYIQEKNGHSI